MLHLNQKRNWKMFREYEVVVFLQHFCKILVDFQMSAKAKVTIAAGAVVCNECELKGEVTLSNTI